jgi:hypothetical protein
MKFAMGRNSGIVMFKDIAEGSSVTIYLPNKKKQTVKVDKSGEASFDFTKIRKDFLREEIKIEISHIDFETIIFVAEIRATKLIQKPVSLQVKKGK